MDPQDAATTRNLTKYYSDFWGRKRVLALDSLNLTIHHGEIFGLLGPNGSGKTTFVKLLLGLLFPTDGTVTVLGCPATSCAVKARIGYLPEESSLHAFMDADETMRFHGRLYGMQAPVIEERAQKLLAELDLTAARKRRVKEYSRGMARRLGLACTLMHQPELLILDEPTSGLDPVGARKVKDILLKLKENGTTILLCSHLLSEVETVCDRIAMLENGRLRKVGSVRELLTRPDMLTILLKLSAPGQEAAYRKALEAAGASVVDVAHPSMTLEELFMQIIGKTKTGSATPETEK